MMKSLSGVTGPLLLLFLLPLPLLAATVEDKPGEWEPININDISIQKLGAFAVAEHNMETQSDLKFEVVMGGYQQVVTGMNYKLLIVAKDKEESGRYEAIVWVKDWEHHRQLTSFKPLLQD